MNNFYHAKLYDDILLTFSLEAKGLEGLTAEIHFIDEASNHCSLSI